MEELLQAFETGDTPTGDDFAALIHAAYNTSDITVYDSVGKVTVPLKFHYGNTYVTENKGGFNINYEHVEFDEVFLVHPQPMHDGVLPAEYDLVMSAVITMMGLNSSSGKAYTLRDNPNNSPDDIYYNNFAPIGTKIQYFVIGR